MSQHLLSSSEWSALDGDAHRHSELVDGVVVRSSRPLPRHQRATMEVVQALHAQLDEGLVALMDVEIALREGARATHRAPDVTVTTRAVLRSDRPWMAPSDALLVVEVVSPGSVTSDRVLKVHEYRTAGIPAYLIVDLEHHELLAFQLDAGGQYVSTTGDRVALTVAGTVVHVGWVDLDLA